MGRYLQFPIMFKTCQARGMIRHIYYNKRKQTYNLQLQKKQLDFENPPDDILTLYISNMRLIILFGSEIFPFHQFNLTYDSWCLVPVRL